MYALQMAGSVRPLDKSAVHKICSGQVVLTLGTAVKELVENSLDAGCTAIEVRLKNYGSELIEVTDNGPGVREEDFQALTLKHHTSKVKEFEDLVTVGTFGFRGEALSSLCELSELSITTRHKDSPVGCRIEYGHHGNIIKQTTCATQIGTTVELRNLFATLPVRHKEFIKNLKREFGKMLQVLYGYCLISTGARITCTHQSGQGKKAILFTTRGNESIKENIIDVFGSKQLSSLLEFEQHDLSTQVMEDYGLSANIPILNMFRIEGFVSSCQHGLGRSSTDRQFYFINGRPCDTIKVSKSVNEVYHSYNRHQYPMVVLNISLKKDAVDVNVTPDKRQLLLSNETWLLAVLKSSLLIMYEKTPATLDISLTPKPSFDREDSSPKSKSPGSPISNHELDETNSFNKKKRFTLGNLKRTFSLLTNGSSEDHIKNKKQPKLDQFLSFSSPKCSSISKWKVSPVKKLTVSNVKCDPEDFPPKDDNVDCVQSEEFGKKAVSLSPKLKGAVERQIVTHNRIYEEGNEHDDKTCNRICEEVTKCSDKASNGICDELIECGDETCNRKCEEVIERNDEASVINEVDSNDKEPNDYIPIQDLEVRKIRRVVEIPYNITNCVKEQTFKTDKQQHRKFRAKIVPTDNSAAENELKKEITREMFSKMHVIGQFNLGFIITKLSNDLFIVDQHATDEKYNFETLVKQTVLETQKLIRPYPLELTAASEAILLENLNVFQKNGFEFLFDESAEAPKRVMLTSIPVSKNWVFGKEDVEELIFMLSDAPGAMCRPSRIQQMFASRACRKSVMIGTYLNHGEMKKLVGHMGELEQPWNCPHGRPTLRHLLSLNLLLD